MALRDVAGDRFEEAGLTVWDGDVLVGCQVVDSGVVGKDVLHLQSDREGDGRSGKSHVCIVQRFAAKESSNRCVRLVGGCADGPALPVDGAVADVRNLGRKDGVDVQRVEHEAKT